MKHRALWLAAVCIVLPYLVYEFMSRSESLDARLMTPHGHFYVVTSVAVLATFIGAAAAFSALRLRNIKVTFLALAYISLAGMFTIHGLSTQGFILHHPNSLTGFTAQLSILMASVWMCLSVVPADHRLMGRMCRVRYTIVPVWVGILLMIGLISFINPHWADAVPMKDNPMQGLLAAVVTLLNGYTMFSYYRAYRYSRFPLQLAIVYSSGWLVAAQFIMIDGTVWNISWWLYHFLLLFSMLVMLVGLYLQYSSKKSLLQGFKALFTTDPAERITNSISSSVKALIAATESKDTYTAGHNLRVSMYALRLAEHMELQPEQLRALAQGAIVHDVGKLQVPDAVLNKPGRLEETERAMIELHPVSGYELCRKLGFMREELDIIRHHHERWDGKGYPDRLAGEAIPLLARIVAVADVYDALTSTRSYRKAWSHEQAMQLLEDGKGTQFDPRCVDAWVEVCGRDPQAYSYTSQFGDVRSLNLIGEGAQAV